MYLSIYYTCLWFCLFWACWVSGSFSGEPGHIFFCVGLRCVECWAGTIYLSASLGWVAGLYRFSSFGLCCGRYGMLEMVGGWSDFLGRLQFVVCFLGRWLSVVGLLFPYNNFFLLFWYYLSVSYIISC